MPTTSSKRIREGFEPIPGYVLEEVLGRGGFGEVWRASAPGGLKKAVKFVFGTQDQSRAERELKSLERIKGVQHPFLLTLERFEAIDEQLVIVTELADGSLEDVFKEHRDRGSCGIPRDVLLAHLHDTADALDYLHERYKLQHLDIKPANLLMVGGHVKVADFGLLKDLRDVECSIVGGLTPIYAPPEIFDGRPSMHSDQYSLAVMYQELLTGTRPFSGRTIAQLATQHVHSAPNLEPLPPGDRPVVAKALEKNPERRFATCEAFVDALRAARGQKVKASPSSVLPASDTKVTDDAAAVEDLPQLNASNNGEVQRDQQHAIVVAIGGTGAECLLELRRRVADPHQDSKLDLHSVLIDTDMATTYSMRVGEASDRVPSCRIVYTPLRSAHDYRQAGTERLSTISRRWIYNVPRSGSTEGMRPLGRLALIDHGPTVKQELMEALKELATASGDATPSVYVVASLSGGTGSGMYIDLVHLIRHLMDESVLAEAPIISLLSSARMHGSPATPLALHDSQAAILELEHFMKAGNGYPGDQGAQFPSVPAARTPLHDVYIIAEPSKPDLAPSVVEVMTDYIWSDTGATRELLAAARQTKLPKENGIQLPSIRSVGVVPLARSRRLERQVLAPVVVRELLVGWLGLPSNARRAATTLADRIARRIDLDSVLVPDPDSLSEAQTQAIKQVLASQAEQQLDPNEMLPALVNACETMKITGGFREDVADVIRSLYRELSICLNDSRADVTTLIECLKLLHKRCETEASRLRGADGETRSLDGVPSLELAASIVASYHLDQITLAIRGFQNKLEACATNLAVAIVQISKLVSSDANPWDDVSESAKAEFGEIVRELHEANVNRFVIRLLSDGATLDDPVTMVHELTDLAVPSLEAIAAENRAALIAGTRASMAEETVGAACGVTAHSDSRSQTAVTQEIQEIRDRADSDEPLTVEEAVIAVQPELLTLGGRQRLLLVVGVEHERTQLEPQVREAFDGALTVAVVPGATPKLIHEAQQIELTNILSRLTVLTGGNKQVTGRLASRTDVQW